MSSMSLVTLFSSFGLEVDEFQQGFLVQYITENGATAHDDDETSAFLGNYVDGFDDLTVDRQRALVESFVTCNPHEPVVEAVPVVPPVPVVAVVAVDQRTPEPSTATPTPSSSSSSVGVVVDVDCVSSLCQLFPFLSSERAERVLSQFDHHLGRAVDHVLENHEYYDEFPSLHAAAATAASSTPTASKRKKNRRGGGGSGGGGGGGGGAQRVRSESVSSSSAANENVVPSDDMSLAEVRQQQRDPYYQSDEFRMLKEKIVAQYEVPRLLRPGAPEEFETTATAASTRASGMYVPSVNYGKPKNHTRFLNNQVVSTHGERHITVKKEESDEMKATYCRGLKVITKRKGGKGFRIS